MISTARGLASSTNRAQLSSKRYIVPAALRQLALEARDRSGDHVGEHGRAATHQLDQLRDRRRAARDDLVCVIRHESDQRVRQLELPAQHGLGPAVWLTADHPAARELRDLGRCVEARAVHVTVGASVTGGVTGLGGGGQQRGAHARRERAAVQDPVSPTRIAGLSRERAQRAVGKPV